MSLKSYNIIQPFSAHLPSTLTNSNILELFGYKCTQNVQAQASQQMTKQ